MKKGGGYASQRLSERVELGQYIVADLGGLSVARLPFSKGARLTPAPRLMDENFDAALHTRRFLRHPLLNRTPARGWVRRGGSSSQPSGSSAAASGGSPLQPPHILVNLCLQLADLFDRPFVDHGKIPRVLDRNFVSVGFRDALHPPHLFDGLVELNGSSI